MAVGARAVAARRRGRRAGWLLSLVAAAAALAALTAWAGDPIGATLLSTPATPAGSTVPAAPAGPGQPHVAPALGAQGAGSAQSCTTNCSLVSLHAGGVVQHAELVYFIFWLPSSPGGLYLPPSYAPALSSWLSDAAAGDYTAGNVFSVTQQYYDLSGPKGTRNFVPYALSASPARVVTDPLPASGCTDNVPGAGALPYCLTDAQIQTELQSVISADNLPQSINASYVLFTPNTVGSCLTGASSSCAYSNYCGYHSFFSAPLGTVVYSEMPWLYRMPGCDPQLSSALGYPNGSPADPEVGTVSRELIGMMTDPHLNAWYDSSGHEIGDKCAADYGPGGPGSTLNLQNNGLGYWNQSLNGDEYLMQLEFSNRDSNLKTTGCVGTDTDSQPVVKLSVSPNPPRHGSPARFTATITDKAGVLRTRWTMGDGAVVFGNPVQHTYTAAGPERVTALVIDNHGNEKVVTITVNVT